MKYKYELDGDAKAIFSEIWYDKGWNAYVDGKKINYFRANYILRGVCLGRGSHILEFKFEPASYLVGDKISMASFRTSASGCRICLVQKQKKSRFSLHWKR